MRLVETIRSILVYEETEDSITLRAASERGTRLSALALWWTLWRHTWLPHRWSQYDDIEATFPDRPSKSGWRWHNCTFWVREGS